MALVTSSADKHRETMRKRRQAERDKKNEIGKLPKIKYPELRKAGLDSLEVFLAEMVQDLFTDPFGDVQLSSISHESNILETGTGNLNKLEPRAYGKSTRSILGAVWACLKGVQDFVMVCCDSTEKSTDLLKLALVALSENQKLLGCFPELFCFHHLDGNSHRCQYQTYKGKRTKISIKGDTIYFPVLGEGIASEGAMIVSRPFKKARGKNVEGRRPSVVILDDVQSTEDAMSPTSVSKCMKILTTDIAFLGTRKKPVAIINNATIIRDRDYPSQLALTPAFTTVRYKMVESMPENTDLWDEYNGIRHAYNKEDVGDRKRAADEALEFYIANRDAMDKGSAVTWDHAYSTARGEVSTIQAAMNFIADYGIEAFESECQNDPQEEKGPIELLPVDEIMAKVNGVPANIVPNGFNTLVAMIDVHEEILDYEVWAFNERFSGAKVLGGTWPDQKSYTFNHSNPPTPLSYLYPGMTVEARIDIALDDLFGEILGREWMREDDVPLRILRCLVDANGNHSQTIKNTCRASEFAAVITPSYGMGITAKKLPISRLPNNRGRADIGPEWAPKKASKGEIPSVIFDANFWKTRFHAQLAMPKGEHGSLMLHGGPAEAHRRSAEAYRAERPIEVTANGRTVKEWQLLPNQENHPLDCAVGCMVAASICGVSSKRKSLPRTNKKKKRRILT